MLYMNGNAAINRKQLNLIPVTKRENVSDKWQGVQHGQLATAVVKQAKATGLEVLAEKWYVNKTRTDLFGTVDFSLDSLQEKGLHLDIGQGATFSMGVRHSNAGRYAVSFAVGGTVAVCQNGIFTGDFLLKHRHTSALNLEELVSAGIKEYIDRASTLQDFVVSLQGEDVSDQQAASFILQSSESVGGFINFRYLEGIYELWRNPPHEEFHGRTLWSLYNAYTEAGKVLSPPRQMKMLRGLRDKIEADFFAERAVAVRTT